MVARGYMRNSHMQKSHLIKNGISQYYDVIQSEPKEKAHEEFAKEPYVLQQKRENEMKQLVKSLFY